MRQYLPNLAIFIVLAAALIGGWWYVNKTFFPPPEPKPPEPAKPYREAILALAGTATGTTEPAKSLILHTTPPSFEKPAEKPKDPPKPIEPPKITPAEPVELIALGDPTFFTHLLLTTRGGAIQQLTLTRFDEADRLGREVKGPGGKPQPLRLIPGVIRKRSDHSLTDIHANPELDRPPTLVPGRVPVDVLPQLSEPSYVILHYPAEDDPLRDAKDPDRMNDDYPSPELGTRTWTVVEKVQPTDGGEWRVAFETTLGAPYFLKLRKTYTLKPKEYHVGFTLDVTPLPGRAKGKGIFRYQIAGPRGLPVEGEWYTSAYRNALTGKLTSRGGAYRDFQDSATITTKSGGDKVPRGEDIFAYAAVATQYFASAIALDDTQSATVRAKMWDYVRPTREPLPGDHPEQPFLGDISIRAVASPIDPEEPVSHKYLIYDGPAKVRLLKMMAEKADDDRVVDEELVDRYLDKLSLKTMTDYHSPNFFGRLANAIWWSDVVIMFTNLMHSVLYGLHRYTGLPWGVCIIILTVFVRMMLMIPSRKQQIVMARQQEKMARMKPEIDKLQEKYKDNPEMLRTEKAKLMFQHGMNPMSTMGGCLLLFAQMPVFMGLYFCLQESVFFRLQDFLWVPNLAAPDMTVWWTEQIPYLSSPENLGGSIYLGPFLNVLPLLSTSLIFIQQRLTMPPPTDEVQEQQQKMMKFMIVFMAVFFYKVPAGLCLYFICSTSWALMERKLIPKPKAVLAAAAAQAAPAGQSTEAPTNGSGGGFLSRMKTRVEEMRQQADDQTRRQIRNDQPPSPGPGGPRDKKKKRKK